MIRLNENALTEISRKVAVPTYDRRSVHPGIVHIGVGAFHRAHQCVYLDDLLEHHGLHDWGISGCGVMPFDATTHTALAEQDCLYTLLERDAAGDRGRVIGCIQSVHFGPDDPNTVLDLLAAPETRIITLTITEGGYFVDDATGSFDHSAEDVRRDLAEPEAPRTAIGYLVEGLARRRRRGLGPVSILSCDNLQSNGVVTRTAVVSFAELLDPALARWIELNVAFPNCMVDRITPQTTDDLLAAVRDAFGYHDACPVVSEPFRQWVIEDSFVAGRPPWEDAGAQMVSDVAPYETMKLRLLNASHAAMGYLSYLAGFNTIDAVIQDSSFRRYIREMMDLEVTPILPDIPGVNLTQYKATLIERFGNTAISDHVLRICRHGSSKMPKFILPSIADRLQRGESFSRLALCVAAWIRFLSGVNEEGLPIPIDDPNAERLTRAAAASQINPGPICEMTEIFGQLGQSSLFIDSVAEHLKSLRETGARETLRRSFEA